MVVALSLALERGLRLMLEQKGGLSAISCRLLSVSLWREKKVLDRFSSPPRRWHHCPAGSSGCGKHSPCCGGAGLVWSGPSGTAPASVPGRQASCFKKTAFSLAVGGQHLTDVLAWAVTLEGRVPIRWSWWSWAAKHPSIPPPCPAVWADGYGSGLRLSLLARPLTAG